MAVNRFRGSELPGQAVEMVGQSVADSSEKALLSVTSGVRSAVDEVTKIGYHTAQATVGEAVNTVSSIGYNTVVGGLDAVKQTGLSYAGAVLTPVVDVADSFKHGKEQWKSGGLKGMVGATWSWTGGALLAAPIGAVRGGWNAVKTTASQLVARPVKAGFAETGSYIGGVLSHTGAAVGTLVKAPIEIAKPVITWGFRAVAAPFHYIGNFVHSVRSLFPAYKPGVFSNYQTPTSSGRSAMDLARSLTPPKK